jgi:predicted ferric reductase
LTDVYTWGVAIIVVAGYLVLFACASWIDRESGEKAAVVIALVAVAWPLVLVLAPIALWQWLKSLESVYPHRPDLREVYLAD